MMLALWAYLFPQWRHLCIVTALPMLLIFPTYPFLSESPRWLLSKGKTGEARKVLDKISRWNQRPGISDQLWEDYLKGTEKEFSAPPDLSIISTISDKSQ